MRFAAKKKHEGLRLTRFVSRLHWLFPNRVHRLELIQTLADALAARRYLEIGVRDGRTICALHIAERVGVDPIPPSDTVLSQLRTGSISYYQMASDDFFRHVSRPEDAFDLVFIDGLHTYRQSLEDATNALTRLSPRGIILLHDCSPSTAARATPATSLDQLKKNPPSGWDGYWNGDVWKTVLYFRASRRDLGCYTLETDHGIGILAGWLPHEGVPIDPRQIDTLTFADLERHRKAFLGLRRPWWILRQLSRPGTAQHDR